MTEFKLTADQLADFLVERQAKLKLEYREDLDQLTNKNPLLFEAGPAIVSFETTFSRKKFHEDQMKAALEEYGLLRRP